jgi:hypothetical protein
MQLNETFERLGVEMDTKARRRSNVSESVANITAAEIEQGVSLERLETIGVPVLRYSTQVTIHGILPDFEEGARQAGYKSVVKNGNGSVGIKYGAIDAEKKRRLYELSRDVRKDWLGSLTAAGLVVSNRYENRDACLAALRSFPRDLICGYVEAGRAVYSGDYYVVATIGAIPAANWWGLAGALWGVKEQSEWDSIKAEREREMAALTVEREARNAEVREQVALERQIAGYRRKAISEIVAANGGRKAKGIPTAVPYKLTIVAAKKSHAFDATPPMGAYTVEVSKRGPVGICYRVSQQGASFGLDKWTAVNEKFTAFLAGALEKGFLYEHTDKVPDLIAVACKTAGLLASDGRDDLRELFMEQIPGIYGEDEVAIREAVMMAWENGHASRLDQADDLPVEQPGSVLKI